MSTLLLNRKARFDYEFLDKYVAGIALVGSEAKAIKAGEAQLLDAFCFFQDNELFLKNFTIKSKNLFFEHDPSRDKKLLLKRKELNKIQRTLAEKHLTIVPVALFLTKNNLIKCEIAIARGKKNYDKRAAIKQRDVQKQIQLES